MKTLRHHNNTGHRQIQRGKTHESVVYWRHKYLSTDLNESEKERGDTMLSVFEQNQKRIAKATLAMPDAMAGVMGGMTKEEAREILEKLALKELKEQSEKI